MIVNGQINIDKYDNKATQRINGEDSDHSSNGFVLKTQLSQLS